MKLVVISDTHGSQERIEEVIDREADFDYLIHAGDHLTDVDFAVDNQSWQVITVKGNCDRGLTGEVEKLFTVNGKQILLTHGHKYALKQGLTRLSYRVAEVEADIVIFGHTHISLNQSVDGRLYFNPGSLTYPRDDSASYGVLKIADGAVDSEIKSF
ncbi:MAG: metallophosphoesterase family protein [Bacillota bacterium]